MMVESLADLVLLAPENEQANLIAYALSGCEQNEIGEAFNHHRCHLGQIQPQCAGARAG